MNMYYTQARQVDGDFLWSVIERDTSQIIEDYKFEEDANKLCTVLNSGGGFQGNTPPFFLKNGRVTFKEDETEYTFSVEE